VARSDLYKRLGVSRTATPESVRRAYLRLAKKLHPDVNRTKGAHEQFMAVKDAYETLANPLLRREYDERLARDGARGFDDTAKRAPYESVIRVSPPFVAPRESKAVRVRTSAEIHRQRQLEFLYTATVAGSSVAFLAGAFFFVAIGGILPGVVSFLMGLSLVLVMLHVLPFRKK
jgi:curved DNA-binding protein CbpA